jgi:hypothetical protein
MLIAPDDKVILLSALFGVFYGSGMLINAEPIRTGLILIGCVFEWALFFILPLVYITSSTATPPATFVYPRWTMRRQIAHEAEIAQKTHFRLHTK